MDVKAKKWEQRANRLSEMIDDLIGKTLDLRDRTKRLENQMKEIKKVVYEDRS